MIMIIVDRAEDRIVYGSLVHITHVIWKQCAMFINPQFPRAFVRMIYPV